MPPRRRQHGEGFVGDYLDSRLNKRPKVVQTYLNTYGNNIIRRIIISRTPVQGFVQSALNTMTMGEWSRNKARLNFDDVYHLFALFELDNGVVLRIEKNSRVSIMKGNRTLGDTMKYVDGVNNTLTQMFEKAEKLIGLKDLYRYDAFQNNCQAFIFTLLRAVDKGTNELREYIMQDPDQLVQSNTIKKTANVVTDMDAFVNYVIKGGKRKTPTKRKTATKRKTNRKKVY